MQDIGAVNSDPSEPSSWALVYSLVYYLVYYLV